MGQPIQNDRIARFTALIDNEAGTLDELCQRVTGGETLVDVCKAWDVPYARVASWLESDAGRWECYERALRLRSDALVAETLAVARGAEPTVIEHEKKDGTVVLVPVLPDHQRDKLIVDTQFRVAAKYDRARFGGETEAPVRKPAPMGDVPLLEVARRQAWVFEKAKRILQGQRAPREPRLLEGHSSAVSEPAAAQAVDDPEDGEI